MSAKIRHGTTTGYSQHRCRCDECRAAHSRYMRTYHDRNPRTGNPVERAEDTKRRMRRIERGLSGPSDPRHGTVTGYASYGCRCQDCRAASREAKRRQRHALKNDRKPC